MPHRNFSLFDKTHVLLIMNIYILHTPPPPLLHRYGFGSSLILTASGYNLFGQTGSESGSKIFSGPDPDPGKNFIL